MYSLQFLLMSEIGILHSEDDDDSQNHYEFIDDDLNDW